MATQASDSIGHKSRTASADELAVIAQRAQAFTNASGTAIAISEGNTDEIVCRARSGSSAPEVGTALRVEGSFTGMCIQTGKELRCDDAETDTRVDTAAIRALGIRSMVVTPIRDEGKVTGVLAVFAPTPHAFTITHVAVLKTMADQISALLQRERKAKDEPLPAAPVPVAAPKLPKPAVPLPPPVVIKSAAPPPPQPVPLPAPVRSTASSAAKIETRPVAIAADITPAVPIPRREEKREYKSESFPAHKTSFGTLDAVAGQPSRSSGGKVILGGLLVAAMAVGGWAWFHFRTNKSTSPAPSQSARQQETPATPAAPAPAAVSQSPVAAASVATPPASVVVPSSPRPGVSEKPESKKAEPKKKEQPDTLRPPDTVSVGEGPSKIAQSVSTDTTADVSPSLAVGGGNASGLASLARPVDTSAPAMVATQSNLVNAKLVHTVNAIYPEIAMSRRISGIVVVRVTVGKDGKVKNPTFVSGPVVFRDAAFEAVKQWQFKPAELNGQVIEQETEVRMKFNP